MLFMILTFATTNAPKTLFKDIFQVSPGENVIFSFEKKPNQKNFLLANRKRTEL